jgi:hypothetical protein
MTEEITREEAIKTIEELIIPCAPNSKYGIVGRMAISALQDRPIDCEKCEVGNPCLYCKHDFKEKTNENID